MGQFLLIIDTYVVVDCYVCVVRDPVLQVPILGLELLYELLLLSDPVVTLEVVVALDVVSRLGVTLLQSEVLVLQYLVLVLPGDDLLLALLEDLHEFVLVLHLDRCIEESLSVQLLLVVLVIHIHVI